MDQCFHETLFPANHRGAIPSSPPHFRESPCPQDHHIHVVLTGQIGQQREAPGHLMSSENRQSAPAFRRFRATSGGTRRCIEPDSMLRPYASSREKVPGEVGGLDSARLVEELAGVVQQPEVPTVDVVPVLFTG